MKTVGIGCLLTDGHIFINMKKHTNDTFISKAKDKHGDKYDYSKLEYVNNKMKVVIICPDHGEFEQEANSHLRGVGCIKCTHNHTTNDTFISKAKDKHGDKYDYSKVEYTNNKMKVVIICPDHGEFEQEGGSHLKGCGCPKCAGHNKTTEEYIDQCKKIHGDKYDYSKVEYIGVFTKVKIICPKHGEFNQLSDKHLKGNGCPKCRESKGEMEIRKYLSTNNVDFTSQHKFLNCKDIRPLAFDFYLPDYNMCIEFDGRQHFEVIDRWGGIEGLEDQIRKDEIKNEFCINNKINLMRISHKESIYNRLSELNNYVIYN